MTAGWWDQQRDRDRRARNETNHDNREGLPHHSDGHYPTIIFDGPAQITLDASNYGESPPEIE
jgi:hypothetical protein